MGRDTRPGRARAAAQTTPGGRDQDRRLGRRPPRALCFDAFDTLVTLDQPGERLQAGLAACGATVSLALARRAFLAEARCYRSHIKMGRDPAGRDSLVELCAHALGDVLRAEAEVELPIPTLAELLLGALSFRLLPGALDAVDRVAAAGIPLAVVSNWDCSLPAVLDSVGLGGRFVTVVASAVVGLEKPDPAIWSPALAALGTTAGETWHVGDDYRADVLGARAAGLTPVLVGDDEADDDVVRLTSLAALPALLGLG